MNAYIKYEIIADAFYRMTGMLAPGKDAWEGPSLDDRCQEFTRWNDEHKTIIFHMLNAVEGYIIVPNKIDDAESAA